MPAVACDGATLRNLASQVRRDLEAVGITEAHLDARLLVCAATGTEHSDLVSDGDRPVRTEAVELARMYVARRAAREPVSRILGRREFWSLDFELNDATLDPRADSETVIEAVIGLRAHMPWHDGLLRICDLGTGSGCLLVALLTEFAHATGVGTDISAYALEMAGRNADAHGVSARADFVRADWTNGLTGPFDVIVSNPPYIASADIAGLAREVRDHDPRRALDGGADGLDAYRRIIGPARDLLSPGGWLAVEVGDGRASAVRQMMLDAGYILDRPEVSVVCDLGGHPRCVRARAS